MKKCERCGAVEIPNRRFYCDECRKIRKREVDARKYEERSVSSSEKGRYKFLKSNRSGKLTRNGTVRLSLAVIRQAVRDKKWWWLESENSDLFFDLAEIDKGKFIDKVLEQLY